MPYVEHPDHIYSARFTREALKTIGRNIPVEYHVTYPTSSAPFNVDPVSTQAKRDIVGTFFVAEDGANGGAFVESVYNGSWVSRRIYKKAHALDAGPEPNIVPQPLVNIETQQCLASQGLGLPPTMQVCHGSAGEKWSFQPSGQPAGGDNTALLEDSSGNCLANQNGVLLEAACSSGNSTQQWTPWDFGKIFGANASFCLEDAGALTAASCPPADQGQSGFTQAMLWTRYVVNTQGDPNVEAGLVGDPVGDGSSGSCKSTGAATGRA